MNADELALAGLLILPGTLVEPDDTTGLELEARGYLRRIASFDPSNYPHGLPRTGKGLRAAWTRTAKGEAAAAPYIVDQGAA